MTEQMETDIAKSAKHNDTTSWKAGGGDDSTDPAAKKLREEFKQKHLETHYYKAFGINQFFDKSSKPKMFRSGALQ